MCQMLFTAALICSLFCWTLSTDLTVDYNLANKDISRCKIDQGNDGYIGRTYYHNKDVSFRVYLGSAEECTNVIVCKGCQASAQGGPCTDESCSNIKFNGGHQSCDAQERIIFNLLENTVTNVKTAKTEPFVSPVADFILSKDGSGKYFISTLDKINTSDLIHSQLRDGALVDGHATGLEVDLTGWGGVTVIGSGFDCISELETFSRSFGDTRYGQIGNPVTRKLSSATKDSLLPMYSAKNPKEDVGTTCQETVSQYTGVSHNGPYIELSNNDDPQAFSYTFANNKREGAEKTTAALQLEIKDPANCEYIRICFDGALCQPKGTLELVLYHRFYVPTDSATGRPFLVSAKELDTIVFEFKDKELVMKYGSLASRSNVKWVRDVMNLDGGVPTEVTLTAGKCTFRLISARKVHLDEGARNSLLPTGCKPVVATKKP